MMRALSFFHTVLQKPWNASGPGNKRRCLPLVVGDGIALRDFSQPERVGWKTHTDQQSSKESLAQVLSSLLLFHTLDLENETPRISFGAPGKVAEHKATATSAGSRCYASMGRCLLKGGHT